MMEEPIVILMNVARHKAMPKVDMDNQQRLVVKRLLAEVAACP
jgi:hypothetical protein